MLDGYKTVGFSIAVAIFGALEGIDWLNLIPNKETAGLVIAGVGIGTFILRTLTKTPLFGKSS